MADNLQNQLTYARKQRAFAWAKYYESINTRLEADHRNYTRINTVATTSDTHIPAHVITEFKAMAIEIRKTWECPICMDMITPDENAETGLAITNCGHYYCKKCLDTVKRGAEPKCAICRRKIKPNE